MKKSPPLSERRSQLLELPRAVKRLTVFLVDIVLCFLSVWLAFYLRLGEFITLSREEPWSSGFLHATTGSVMLAIPIFVLSGLYKAIFRYSGWPALLTIGRATAIYAVLYFLIFTLIGVTEVPRTIGIIQPILLLLTVGASRMLANIWLSGEYRRLLRDADRPRALIYGAGEAGRQLASAMTNSHEMRVVGFLDDDERLHGQVLNGLHIHNPQDLTQLTTTKKVSDVLLAIPSISRQRRNQILSLIQGTQVAVRTLPSVTQLAQGRVSINDLGDLDVDDLLGRDPVLPDLALLNKNISNKVVLVTGAGGSIGAELCRQIIAIGPTKLLLADHSEASLYNIHEELKAMSRYSDMDVIPLLVSVQDKERMFEIMATWRPETVYHAAAYKHVPLVEHNPAEGIKNNVLGTLISARAAIETGVLDFVLVSTDKAVRPTNIMGASKRLAEMVLQALGSLDPKVKFSIVRFGNVLGSSGSVVPKFRRQIREGGPITLTHPDITRYFMTIPEAAQLVVQAGALTEGGDVFVLDMGEAVRIADLAKRMVELSGLTIKDSQNPYGDIEIKITGLRPGEKLYEELLIGERSESTSHPRILRASEDFLVWEQLEIKLGRLEQALKLNDIKMIRSIMKELVVGYAPTESIVDWVFMEREEHPCVE